MSANGFLQEDDLALYALGLLSAPEAAAVASQLAQDPQAQTRAADMQVLLGVYAEAIVPIEAVPPASIDRLMRSIAQDKNTLRMPSPENTAANSPARSSVVAASALPRQSTRPGAVSIKARPWLGWAGWAIAAALLVTSGLAFLQGTRLRHSLTEQAQQMQTVTEQASIASRERDDLRGQLQIQARQTQLSQAEAQSVKTESAELRAKAAGEVARAQQESAKAANLAAAADQNARERDALQSALAAQANQTAALSAQASTARQIQDALTDATAMRVTLTVPKQKIAPSGRATYVASRGTLLFTASHLAPLRENKVYELWLLPSNGSGPLPAGTFVPDALGNASVVTTQFAKGTAKGFAVTIENAGGSQTPTLPLLLAGT